MIADDGDGMTAATLDEALRYGTRRDYTDRELGRYGLGLKTASLSQCRRLIVASRHSPMYQRVSTRVLDLDHIAEVDRWEVQDPGPDASSGIARALSRGPGTVIVWHKLDRVLPAGRPDGGWARRRIETLTARTADYLSMVFHRFLAGDVGERLTITVNGEKLRPWNPFGEGEERRRVLQERRFEITYEGRTGVVRLRPVVLPPREWFSSLDEWERLSGPQKWNRQQGLYIFRADRLIQSGGWSGMRAADEHTKLARVALDFGTELDGLFQVNVSKMRVTLPSELRPQLERPIHEVCHEADLLYRRNTRRNGRVDDAQPSMPEATRSAQSGSEAIGLALRAAAMEVDESKALRRIMRRVSRRSPHIAQALGFER